MVIGSYKINSIWGSIALHECTVEKVDQSSILFNHINCEYTITWRKNSSHACGLEQQIQTFYTASKNTYVSNGHEHLKLFCKFLLVLSHNNQLKVSQ